MECPVTMRPYLLLAILSSAVVLLPAHAQAQTAAQSAQPAAASPSTPPPSQGGSSIDLTDTRILSDPLFLPRKGQVYGVTAYTLDTPKGDNFKAGVNTGSFTSSDSLVDQTLAYGLLNNLTIRLAQGYGINNRDSTAAATGDVTTGSASGFNDPTVSATFRVLDEPRSPVILNLTASYSPDAFASKAAGGGSDGTIARGGQTAGLSFALGRVTKSFTVAATAASTHVGPQLTELLSNSTSTASDAYWSYNLGLNTQTRFTDRWSLDAGVAFATAGNYDVSNIETGNAHVYAPSSTRTVNMAFNYHFLPNRLVGSVTFTHNSYTDATNTFAKAALDTAVANRMGNVVGVRLIYVFN
jgi:hypothetical protein